MFSNKHEITARLWLRIVLLGGILLSGSLACTLGGLVGDADEAAGQEVELQEQVAEAAAVDDAEEAGEPATDEDTTDQSMSPAAPSDGGGCTNVFYPMVLDQQWIYKILSEGEESKFGMTVSEVHEDGAVVDMLAYDTGVTTSAEVECANGEILNLPSMMLGFLFGEVDGDITLEHEDGVYAPSIGTLEANNWDYSWETDYVASGELTAVSEGEELSATLSDSPVHMEWETEGLRETVEVEAGTFAEAVVVERKTEFEADLTLVSEGESMSLEGTVILDTTLWFVPFQGLVKQEVTRTQLKLGPATFPVESDTVVELVEFYTAE